MTVPLFSAFCVFGAITLGLALRRQIIVRSKGDECLHLLESDAPLIQKQATSARQLQSVDTWGKTLTILTAVSGIAAYVVWWLGW
jgi:hypothetical protein